MTGECDKALIRPDPDWLPYDRARFFYGPEYTGRRENWRREVHGHLKNFLPEHPDWELLGAGAHDERLSIRVGRLQLDFSPENEVCAVGVADHPVEGLCEIRMDEVDCIGSLPKVLALIRPDQIKAEHAEAAKFIATVIQLLQFKFDGLEDAIGFGYAKIMARVDSPTEPFSEVYPDQWRYFGWGEMDDTAVGPSGETLYSVFVSPGSLEAGHEPRRSSAKSGTECRKWLARAMNISPDRPPSNKATIRADALRRWPDLSDRAFDIAWRAAVAETGAEGWSAPGRRPKTPQ